MSQYLVDTILRADKRDETSLNAAGTLPTSNNDSAVRAEIMRIMMNSIGTNGMSGVDKSYLSQLIATRAGITPAAAEARINEVTKQIKATEVEIKAAVDVARKAAAKLTLWMFIGLLVGAFCASYAATIGGRQRDNDNVYA